MAPETNNRAELLPCDVFDLIVGTSTGGLIAIMLGRLHMSIDDCLKQYEKTSEAIFGNPIAQTKLGKIFKKVASGSFYDISDLDAAIRDLLGNRGKSQDEKFLEDAPRCKVIVCVTRSITSKADVLRNYTSQHPTQENYDCSIVEAATATAAAPMFFKSVRLASTSEEWVDGGMRRNNPINVAMSEVNRECEATWLGRPIGCVVSIGTGVVEVSKVSNSVGGLMKSIIKIMSDSEDTADSFLASSFGQQLERSCRYFRFNVPQGLQTLLLDEWKETEKMAGVTADYLSKYDTGNSVRACAQSLLDPDTTITAVAHKTALRDRPCANFVNRPVYLDTLRTFFWNYVDGESHFFVLWGHGGIGKTQLALKFAEDLKSRVSIIWIRADSSNNFNLDYSNAVDLRPEQSRQLEAFDRSLDDILEMTRQYLELHTSEWLLILDNADNIEDFRDFMGKYLPQKGRILVTTRDPRFQGQFTMPDNGMKIEPLDDEQGLELLAKSIPTRLRAKETDSPLQSQELLYLLGNLPLAIAQAAANIVDQQVPLSEYIAQFREASSSLDALRVPIRDMRTKDPRNATQSVNVTWQISFEQLETSSSRSVALLGYICCFHWESIPRNLVRNMPEFSHLSDIEFRDVLARPIHLSLLEEYDTDSWAQLRMHPLVHEYAWNRVGRVADLPETLLKTCSQTLAAIFPLVRGEREEHWQLCSYLAAHALRIVNLSIAQRLESKALARLMQVLSSYLNAFGNVTTACEMSSKALDMAKVVWPDGDPFVNYIRRTKIDCLRNSGRLDYALQELEACLEYLETDAAQSGLKENLPEEKYWTLHLNYFLLKDLNRHDEAYRLATELEAALAAPDAETWTATTLIAKHNTAHALFASGSRSDDTRSIVERVLANVRGADGKLRVPRRAYMAFLNLEARVLLDMPQNHNDPGKALDTYRAVYDESFDTWGVSDKDTWIAANNVLSTLENHPHLEANSFQAREAIINQMLEACAAPGATQARTYDSGLFHGSIQTFISHLDYFIFEDKQRRKEANREHLLELREAMLSNFVLRRDITFPDLGRQKNYEGVSCQWRGHPERAEALHREAIQELSEWKVLRPQWLPQLQGGSNGEDQLLSTYHYNVMLAIARQGRVKDALTYREDRGSVIQFAEDKFGSLQTRLETDERDRMVYEEARYRIASGEKIVKASGWWAEHVAELGRAETRYGPLTRREGRKVEGTQLESSHQSENKDLREGGTDAAGEENEAAEGERQLWKRLTLALRRK